MPEWTEEKHQRLIQMVREGHGWAACGAALGHTANACQVRYNRCTPSAEKIRKPAKRSPDLSPEQIETARKLRSAGERGRMDLRVMAKKMGVREIQLARIFLPDTVEHRRKKDSDRAPRRGAERRTPIRPPQYVLDERECTYAPQHFSRELFGDPRPGRSALDKRGAA